MAGSRCLPCATVGMEWEAGLSVSLPLPLGCSQKQRLSSLAPPQGTSFDYPAAWGQPALCFPKFMTILVPDILPG